jgi:sarcosine oxidase subunit beta
MAAHEEIAGGIELEEAGSLDLFLTAAQADEGDAAAAGKRREGLDVRRVGPDEVAELEPALDASRVVGATWTPSDLLLNPFRLTLGLLDAAVGRGAHVVTGVRAERLLSGADRATGLHTSHGEVSTPCVVLATNAWTPALAPSVAGNLTPIREHVCVTEPVPRVLRAGFETNRCNEYWRQMQSGEIVIGGFATADDGMGIGTYSMEARPMVPPLLAGLLGELFPALADVRIVRCWAGLLDFAALEIPMVGPLPTADGGRLDGAYLACGLTGHGMPYAPVIGLLLSELIVDGRTSTLAVGPFDPGRYAGQRHPPTWLEPCGGPA